jgi:hypothetical protein
LLAASQQQAVALPGYPGRKTAHILQRLNLVTQTSTEGLWDMTVPDNMVFQDDTPFWWADRFRPDGRATPTNRTSQPPRFLGQLAAPRPQGKNPGRLQCAPGGPVGPDALRRRVPVETQNGQYRWFRAVGKTVRDENGKPLRVAGSLIDIQALKELNSFQLELEAKVQARTAEIEGLLASSQIQTEQLEAAQGGMQNILLESQRQEQYLNELI